MAAKRKIKTWTIAKLAAEVSRVCRLPKEPAEGVVQAIVDAMAEHLRASRGNRICYRNFGVLRWRPKNHSAVAASNNDAAGIARDKRKHREFIWTVFYRPGHDVLMMLDPNCQRLKNEHKQMMYSRYFRAKKKQRFEDSINSSRAGLRNIVRTKGTFPLHKRWTTITPEAFSSKTPKKKSIDRLHSELEELD